MRATIQWREACQRYGDISNKRTLEAAEEELSAIPDELRIAPKGWYSGKLKPALRLARSIHVDGVKHTTARLKKLVTSPHLTRLRTLNLKGWRLKLPDIGVLAQSDSLSELRRLTLSTTVLGTSNPTLDGESLTLFASSPIARTLKSLDFANNEWTTALIGALLNGTELNQLESLDLAWGEIGAAQLRLLAESPKLHPREGYPGLRRLSLEGEVGQSGVRALAESRLAGCLEHLTVRCSQSDFNAVHALATAGLERLESLKLEGSQLGPDGVATLLRPTHLPRLHSVEFWARLSARAGFLIGELDGRKKLQRLNLVNATVGDSGLAAMLESKALEGLRELGLSHQKLTDASAKSIASSALLRDLERLDISRNHIGDDGLEALARSPMGELEHLNLAENKIGVRGATALAISKTLMQLESLVLSECPIGDNGMEALATWPGLASLQALLVRDCNLGDDAFRALATCPHLGSLEVLNLGGCMIGDESLASLLDSPAFESLRDLQFSPLTTEGYRTFAHHPAVARLERVFILRPSNEGKEALFESPYLRESVRNSFRPRTKRKKG